MRRHGRIRPVRAARCGTVGEPASGRRHRAGAREARPTLADRVPHHVGRRRGRARRVHLRHGHRRFGLPREGGSRSSWPASRSPCSWRSPRSSSRRCSRSSARSDGCPPTRTSTAWPASTSRSSAGRRCCCRSCSSSWRLPQAGIVLPAIPTAIVALSLNYGSYMTEVFRSGIEAVPHGQTEAAQSLGMSPRTTFRRIVVAAGVPHRHAGHRQRLRGDDQGLVAGVRRGCPGRSCGARRPRGARRSSRCRRSSSPRSSTGC